MNHKQIDNMVNLYKNNLLNLSGAIQASGGAVQAVLENGTLEDFLLTCARNNIHLTAKHQVEPKLDSVRVDSIREFGSND